MENNAAKVVYVTFCVLIMTSQTQWVLLYSIFLFDNSNYT